MALLGRNPSSPHDAPAREPDAISRNNFHVTPTAISAPDAINAPTPASESTVAPNKPNVLQRPEDKQEVTILLIGETGSGKTAFMSLLVNLLRGRTVLELTDMHDETARSGLTKTHSQTTAATLYATSTHDGLQIRILDTPGLADTRGITHDAAHRATIKDAITESIESIDAILIIANGTTPRLTVATDYTLNVITTMFPCSIVDNIGILLTNGNRRGLNFQTSSLPDGLKQSPYWAIQNPLPMLKKYHAAVENGMCEDEEEKNEWEQELVVHYERSVRELNNLFKWLGERETKPTREIVGLFEKAADIESRIEMALSNMTDLAEQSGAWRRLSSSLENNKTRKDELELSIKQIQDQKRWGYLPSNNYNTVCLVEGCHTNCHAPCKMRFTNGWMLGLRCSAFDWWGTCKMCRHKTKEHRHYKRIHTLLPSQVDTEHFKELQAAASEEGRLQALKDSAQTALERITAKQEENQAILHSLIEEYTRMALSKNYAGHIRSAIELLELHKKGLSSKGRFDAELKLVSDMIKKLQEKLDIHKMPEGA